MKMLVMIIALGLLIVISGVQAVQLVGLKTKLNANLEDLGATSGHATTKISTGSSGGTGGLSKNLEK